MSRTVAELMAKLTTDPFRAATSFSLDLAAANKSIFEAGEATDAVCSVLREWLQKNQPCLFGRIAARQELITYCVLTENDLRQSDESICAKIQKARTQWTREGFAGRKSGFIILAVSPTIAFATPDQNLQALVQRLCSLYLLREIELDQVYHDELFLEQSADERRMWQWLAGVNYFCANADGRWWQDHRIPGGAAFSVNSVGHLAKTSALAQEMLDHESRTPAEAGESFRATKVDSLEKALEFAMRTIALASDAPSGKATELLPLAEGASSLRPCPVKLPSFLSDRDCRYYKSYYHTDFTIPSEYFLPNIKRPSQCKARTMEFTYLFDKDVDNPDFQTMGAGRRIRGESQKSARIEPTSQLIESNERLVHALKAE